MKRLFLAFILLSNLTFGQDKDKTESIDRLNKALDENKKLRREVDSALDSILTLNNVQNKSQQNYLNIYFARLEYNKLIESLESNSFKKDSLKKKHYIEFLDFYSSYINSFPNDRFGYQSRALHYFSNGNFNESIKDIDKLCSFSNCENSIDTYRMFRIRAFSKFALKQDGTDDYVKYFDDSKKYNQKFVPNSDDFFIQKKIEEKIEENINKKKYSESISLINKLRKIAPELDTININNRAGCYMKLKDYQSALNDYKILLTLKKRVGSSILNDKARCEQQLGLFNDAISTYTNVLEKRPQTYISRYERGLLYFKMGQIQNACSDFEQVLLKDKNHEDIEDWTSICTFLREKESEGVKNLDDAVKKYPNDGKVITLRAKANFFIESYKNAITDFDRIIQMTPQNGEFYENRGDSKYKLGLLKDAILDFGKAIQFKELNKPYTKRGNCYFELKMYNEALKDYETSISIVGSFYFTERENRESILQILKETKK